MRTVIAIVFIVSTVVAQAQSNAELKALVEKSFSYFPRIKEAEKATEIGEVRTQLAQSGYLPSVALNASYNYIDPVGQATFPIGPDQTRSIQFQPHNNYNAAIGINQILFDFGRTQAQIEKSKAELQSNTYTTTAAKLQLASQVANIYYGLIYLKKSIVLQDSVIGFFTTNKKIVEGRVRQGDALQIDLSNIENSIEQERSRKVEFERLYQRQLALLNYTTGVDAEPSNDGFDFSTDLTGEDALDQTNPDLLAASQKVLSAQADIKLAQRNQFPTLNLVANAGFRNGYQPDIEEIRFNYLAGVTLSIPIFQGRRLHQSIALSQKSFQLSELSKANLTATLQKDLRSSQADQRAYEAQITHAEAQLKTASEALQLTRIRYERGVATYLDLIFASTNLQRAALNKVQFEYQVCLSKIEQARILGLRFWE